MAASAIDEAVRQIIAVGGNLNKIALLDNFCWGNTNKPDRLGGLVRASQACYDIAKIYETPFISGKDSLNNEYQVGDKSIAIPPTLLISALGIMDDVSKATSMDVKNAGNLIYIIGDTKDEMGGSHYYDILNLQSSNVPMVDAISGRKLMEALSKATANGLVKACHDCSEGGIGVAAAEMAFAGGLGMTFDLSNVPSSDGLNRDDKILFSESNTRFIVEVSQEHQQQFENLMEGNKYGLIGVTRSDTLFEVFGLKKNCVISTDVFELKESWQKPLRW